MIPADTALTRLIEGNQRFAADAGDTNALASQSRRVQVMEGQEPFAIILGCSDSRVPAELVFDQGLGDLFVIRVAGNIIAPSLLGSVEFAAMHFGTRLVVVLGHTQCGAIKATVDELRQPSGPHSPNLESIVNRIRPTVESLMEALPDQDPETLIKHATRANVRSSVAHLKHGSQVLEGLIANDGLRVVGAEYSLESGLVDFFESVGDDGQVAAIEH